MKATCFISSVLNTLVLALFTIYGFAQVPSAGTIPGQFNVSAGGATEYTIPIQVAPGTAGTAPKLSITYTSNASTNILGAGWTLNGVSILTRGPKSLYTDGAVDGVRMADSDALYLDGVRLIEVLVTGAGDNAQTEYRKEADDLSRIIKFGTSLANARFIVQTKGGITLYFDGSNGSTVRIDNTPLLWAVSRIVDTPGNFMEFRYLQNQHGDYSISSIRYTGHEVRDETGNLIPSSSQKPYAAVDFEYDNISRPIDTYIVGRRIQRTFRLKSVASRVATAPSDGPSTNWPLLTRYEFEYEDRNTNNRFVLNRVRQFGDDGQELQPTKFTYSQPQTGWKEANFQLPFAFLAGEEKLSRGYRFAQLKGGGSPLVDLLFAALVEGKLEAFAFQNQGGNWVPKDSFKPPFAFVSGDGTDLGAIVIDLNGDGRSDLLQSSLLSGQTPVNNAYIATDDGWKSVAGYALPFLVSVDGKHRGKYIFADFSGKGHLDLLYEVDGVRGFLVNTGTQWQSDPGHKPPVALTDAARAIDVNGDGSLELVLPVGNSWQTYQFTDAGWTRMSVPFELPLPGNLPDEAIAMLDLNADGHTDILVSSAQANLRKAFIASSTGWKEDMQMAPTFDLVDQLGADIGAVLLDVNADNKLDVIANRIDANNQVIRYAFSQSSTGWTNLGDAFFVPALLEKRPNVPDAYALIGDIDGDGIKDVANPSGSRNRFGQVFTGNPGGFEENPEFVPPVAFARRDQQDWGVRFTDLNADGLPDVIFKRELTKEGATTQVAGAYINTGTGWKIAANLIPPHPIAADWITGNPMQLVDVDGDGFIDLLYSYRKADGTSIRAYYRNSLAPDGSRKWLEQPNSGLVPPAMFPFAIEKEGDQGVQLIDLNSDGRIDILTSIIVAKNLQNPTPIENCTVINGQQQCSLNRTLFSGTAFLNDGINWKETPSYASPLPFIAKPDRATDPVKPLFVKLIDMDGDRLTDLVARFKHPHDQTKDVNEIWLNTGSGWRLSTIQVPVFLDEPLRNERASIQWMDVNGDGLGDLLYAERKGGTNLSNTWLSSGNGFIPADAWRMPIAVLADQAHDQGFVFSDLNGDGLLDVIYSRLTANGPQERGVFINNGSTWVSADASAVDKVPPFVNSDGQDQGVRLVDVDGNGLPDIIKSYNSTNGGVAERLALLNIGRRSELLLEISPGYDAKTKIIYQTLLEVSPASSTSSNVGTIPWSRVYTPTPVVNQYPVLTPVPTTYVVVQISKAMPGQESRQFFRYGDFRLHATALQPLGYGWREVYDETSGILTRTDYDRTVEMAGKPVREASCWARFAEKPDAQKVPENLCPSSPATIAWITKLNETTNAWKSVDFAPNAGSNTLKIRQVLLDLTTTETWELDKQLVAREITKLTYDAPQAYLNRKLNVINAQVTRLDGTRIETANEYEQEDPARWQLGRLTKVTVTKIGDPSVNNPDTRKTERKITTFTYDAVTGLLQSSIIEPGNQKSLTTAYERDKYGNVGKTTLSAVAEQPRTSSSTYDFLGRFITEEINALDHKTVYVRNGKTGYPITVTDPNNLQTTYTYDGFGRSSSETSPTGVTRIIRRLNSPEIPKEASAGLNVAYGEQVNVGSLPPELHLYDAWGRLVRTITQAFTLDENASRWIHTDQIYDRLGRVEKKSLPYERGMQPLWYKMTYDAFNRVTLILQPDGDKLRTEFKGRVSGGRFVASFDAKAHLTLTELNTRALPVTVTDVQGGRVAYEYDAGDRLEKMIGPTGAVTFTKYDDFGQRAVVSDPDKGRWSYQYNAFGQLREQTDAKGQVTTLEYDLLGRIKRKALSDGTTLEWEYDGSDQGKGKLQRIRDAGRYEQTLFYDQQGRLSRSAVTIDGKETFTTTTRWDDYDRLIRKQFPAPNGINPFVVENKYDKKGFLKRVQSEGGSQLYWQVIDIDELGRVVKEDFGNGVGTITKYNRATGELENTLAKKEGGNTILDLTLEYDAIGSLGKRHEKTQNIIETFTYDPLDRLKTATRSGGATMVYNYDGAGRFRKRVNLEYAYQSDASGGTWQPYHAVIKTRNGPETKIYSYDLNGNLKSGNGRIVNYSTDNLVQEVRKDDTHWIQFDYSPSGERYRQLARDDQREYETIYIGAFEQVREYKDDDPTHPKTTQLSYYLSNEDGVFAIVEQKIDHTVAVAATEIPTPSNASNITSTWYLHKDNLGSVIRVTDGAGELAVRYWYDPWGQQIGIKVLPAGEQFGARLRLGFTSHEQLAAMGLIHMNGRVYDFETGMFLSADPVDLVTGYTQTIDRFAYAQNNPLKYTDPTGYFSFFRALAGAVVGLVTGGPAGAIAGAVIAGTDKTYNFIKENWREIAVAAVAIGVTVATAGAGAGLSGAILSGMAAGAASGATRAALYGGDIGDIFEGAIKGGAIGGISGAAFYGVGSAFSGEVGSLGGPDSFGAIGAHGVVSGGINELEGGSFWTGFASGAFTKASSLFGPEMSGFGENVVRAALVGGTAAVITGGKFANGALIGAFSYAFNDALHSADADNNKVVQRDDEANSSYLDDAIEPSYLIEDALGAFGLVRGALRYGIARLTSRGLITPSKYFGSRTLPQIEQEMMRKGYLPKGQPRSGAKNFYNPKTQRSYNLHHEPGHQGGNPHVDIRRRGGYEERKYMTLP